MVITERDLSLIGLFLPKFLAKVGEEKQKLPHWKCEFSSPPCMHYTFPPFFAVGRSMKLVLTNGLDGNPIHQLFFPCYSEDRSICSNRSDIKSQSHSTEAGCPGMHQDLQRIFQEQEINTCLYEAIEILLCLLLQHCLTYTDLYKGLLTTTTSLYWLIQRAFNHQLKELSTTLLGREA